MPITLRDNLNFPFNGGRGIPPTQVDWSVSDSALTTLLTNLAAAGNTAHIPTSPPDTADGADGDVAIVRLSATQLAGYSKASGVWTQDWTFTGGGGGGTTIDAAFIAALDNLAGGDIVDEDSWFVRDNTDTSALKEVTFLGARAYMAAHLERLLPQHSQSEPDHYPVSTNTENAYVLRRGASPALPARGHSSVVTNAGGTAYELTPTLTKNDILPHVARLPDHTLAASPDLVYLDHDIIQGPAVDATLTVGAWVTNGNQVGYSTFENEGSINENSPLIAIFGPGTLTNYSISTITSANAAWIDDFTHVEIDGTQYALAGSYRVGFTYIREITSPPTGLSAA